MEQIFALGQVANLQLVLTEGKDQNLQGPHQICYLQMLLP